MWHERFNNQSDEALENENGLPKKMYAEMGMQAKLLKQALKK
jgi:hypothetical protein